jgi:hypothetical protein
MRTGAGSDRAGNISKKLLFVLISSFIFYMLYAIFNFSLIYYCLALIIFCINISYIESVSRFDTIYSFVPIYTGNHLNLPGVSPLHARSRQFCRKFSRPRGYMQILTRGDITQAAEMAEAA